MNNKKSTKYRFILTLSDQDIAYVLLYDELKEIELKHSNSENIKSEKRKLFLRILLEYCNTHSRITSKTYASVPSSAATVDPPTWLAPSPPPTSSPDAHVTLEAITAHSGLHKTDGSISFGKFQLKTY